MNPLHAWTRRSFLGGGIAGLGAMAARQLLGGRGASSDPARYGGGRYDGVVSPRHHAPPDRRADRS